MATSYVLFDALTVKHLLIAEALRRAIRRRYSHVDFIITARDYDAVRHISKIVSPNTHIVGEYKEKNIDKIKSEALRIIKIVDIIISKINGEIDRLIGGLSYPNPVESRIIYGLGKKLAILSDSPHSIYPSILSIPLANYLLYSWCIDEDEWKKYRLPHIKLIPYKGFDELTWIRYIPELYDTRYLNELELDEYNYIVLRTEERKASYYIWDLDTEFWIRLAAKLSLKLKVKIVILPRYNDQEAMLRNKLKKYTAESNIIIPPKNLSIGPVLARSAIAVVSGGATMAREASLQGTLGIIVFPQKLSVDRCIVDMGFPLIYSEIDTDNIVNNIVSYLKDMDSIRASVKKIVNKLETPEYAVAKAIYGMMNNA